MNLIEAQYRTQPRGLLDVHETYGLTPREIEQGIDFEDAPRWIPHAKKKMIDRIFAENPNAADYLPDDDSAYTLRIVPESHRLTFKLNLEA